jgi:hypothetical protein
LRFIPTQAGADIDAFAHFASFSLCEIDPTKTEGELTSLLPFRAELRPSTPAWLETPRMFQPGYEAHVDGQSVSVQRSPAGLAMLPLTPGAQQVELVFRSTLSLRASYWTLLAAWAALVALAGTTAIRNLSAPAR